MKREKLNLGNIKVKSFVTKIEGETSKTVKGGDGKWHTFIAHACSDINCYSDFCNSTECGGPVSDNCPV